MMTKLQHTFGDDGVFWISYKDFLKHFPSINRVRLFDDSWTVSQQWTCVNVPWTGKCSSQGLAGRAADITSVDYLETKFQFTTSESGPAVIVLAQPDDRYYYGLRGRMLYSMHFRIYKEDEEDRWIVRSMHNSGAETVFTRSVSAEIEDLEPGTYDVVFKITAVRSTSGPTAEEAIMKYAVTRKEKLLNVGRRLDYAMSKGNLKAMEKHNRRERRTTQKEKEIKGLKKNRVICQQDRERARKRKKRVNDAMNEKMKEFHQKRNEKMKARKERRKAKKAASTKVHASTTLTADSDDKPAQHTPDEHASTESTGAEGAKAEKPATDEVNSDRSTEEQKLVPESPVADTAELSREKSSDIDPEPGSSAPATQKKRLTVAELSKQLDQLDILGHQPQSHTSSRMISPLSDNEEEDDTEWESPVEPPDELEDDDFDWDSEM